MLETYKTPQTDPGNRYHIRLVGINATNKRHTITRLRRFLPDLSWQTAEDMVNTAIQEGSALVRVLNSKVSYSIILYKHIYIMNILILLYMSTPLYLLYNCVPTLQNEVKQLVDVLQRADPPVHLQVYDARKDEVVYL